MICEPKLCSGCGACENICPKNCISLTENTYGELHPLIDEDHCIHCELCKKVCPQINDNIHNRPIKCIAMYLLNHKKRANCASGGAAAFFYKNFLAQSPKNKVVGVAFDTDFNAGFYIVDEFSKTLPFQGSKYVQAYSKDIYVRIGEEIKNGSKILYIGTPCQVAACQNYLTAKNIGLDNIITVDLLCHGVSPNKYLIERLDFYKEKYNLDKIDDLTFRSNKKHKNFHFYFYKNENDNLREFNFYANEDFYFIGFLKNISLRESCYSCKFSKDTRVSDITIGDFIGLACSDKYETFKGNPQNASMILVNTEKGLGFVEQIKNTEDILFVERDYREAVEFGQSLNHPSVKSDFRDKFLELYPSLGFNEALESIIGKRVRKNRIKNFPKKMIVTILKNILRGD